MTGFVLLTAYGVSASAFPVQTDKPDARLLEEKQIGRMAAELENRRAQLELLADKDKLKDALIANLNSQIATLTKLADQYRLAADDRKAALAVKAQIDLLYRQSISDFEKQIGKLERSNTLWKRLGGVALLVGLGLGFFLGRK